MDRFEYLGPQRLTLQSMYLLFRIVLIFVISILWTTTIWNGGDLKLLIKSSKMTACSIICPKLGLIWPQNLTDSVNVDLWWCNHRNIWTNVQNLKTLLESRTWMIIKLQVKLDGFGPRINEWGLHWTESELPGRRRSEYDKTLWTPLLPLF